MAIPELDLKKVNLQAAVGYLISLHDNEVDWNLLGIKVIGLVPTAEDIPEGTYEYGDAYEVGTEPPYDLYIYTRPDGEVHTEGYWFPVGKFPMPGPQGPKGDGMEQIMSGGYGNIQSVQYDTSHGARINGTAVVNYVDSTTGMPNSKSFSMASEMPIVPGKYVSMNATNKKDAVEVKVNDTALSLDYYKIDKSQTKSTIPYWDGTKAGTLKVTINSEGNSVAKRDADGDCFFSKILVNRIASKSGAYNMPIAAAYYGGYSDGLTVEKTPTNTGTLTVDTLTSLKDYPNIGLKYDNQSYIRMDPTSAPDGTLNYIHIDSIDDGNGGYKATGKCFRITVSTREWKVVDLDFGGSTNSTIKNFPVELTLTNCQVDIKDPIVIKGTKTVLSVSVNNYLYSFNTPTVSGADFYWDVTGSVGSGSGPIGTLTLFNPKASSITVEIKAVEIG